MINRAIAILRWTPRVLGILFAGFLSLFAMDVKGPIGLLIHLIPSLVIFAAVGLGWRRPATGGIVFLVLAVVATAYFHTYRHVSNLLIITGPFVVVGFAFLLQLWLGRRSARQTATP